MALSIQTNWGDGQVLTNTALVGEFNYIYNNALSLVSPWTGNMAAGANILTGLGLGSVSAPSLSATGGSNNGIYFSDADTVDIAANGIRNTTFATVASGVNYFSLTPSATGNPLLLAAAGSDTNVGLKVSSKGTGAIDLFVGTTQAVKVNGVASAVNYLDVTPSATGNPLLMAVAGSDTNIGVTASTKGTGSFNVNTNGSARLTLSGTGRLTSRANSDMFIHNAVSMADDAGIALEGATDGVGGSHGVIIVSAPEAGGGGIFYISGGDNTSTMISDFGAGDDADTDGKLCVYSDGDGTYTLKNRLGSTLLVSMFYMGASA